MRVQLYGCVSCKMGLGVCHKRWGDENGDPGYARLDNWDRGEVG